MQLSSGAGMLGLCIVVRLNYTGVRIFLLLTVVNILQVILLLFWGGGEGGKNLFMYKFCIAFVRYNLEGSHCYSVCNFDLCTVFHM